MRYLIDGYNLAFRCPQFDQKSLAKQRAHWITWLAEAAEQLNLNFIVVFDSSYAPGHQQRCHYALLEIYYTDQGQSADEWILHELAEGTSSHAKPAPPHTVVITSDRLLAVHARHLGARTQTVESFLQTLRKRLAKKEQKAQRHPPGLQKQQAAVAPLKVALHEKAQKKPHPSDSGTAKKPCQAPFSTTSEAAFAFYLSTFEKSYQQQLEEENSSEKEVKRGQGKAAKQLLSTKNRPKQQQHTPQPASTITDTERLRRLFERRYEELIGHDEKI